MDEFQQSGAQRDRHAGSILDFCLSIVVPCTTIRVDGMRASCYSVAAV